MLPQFPYKWIWLALAKRGNQLTVGEAKECIARFKMPKKAHPSILKEMEECNLILLHTNKKRINNNDTVTIIKPKKDIELGFTRITNRQHDLKTFFEF